MGINKVVVVDILRTPWGRPCGSMERLISSDLAAAALKALLLRTGVAPEAVDQVVFGQAHPSTYPNNIGHYAWLKAGLPEEVPGYTVQSNTASALQAVRSAYYLLSTGNERTCIAGGADSYSAAPFVLRDVRNRFLPQHRVVLDSIDEAECCTQPAPLSRMEQYQEVHGTQQSEKALAFATLSRANAARFAARCGGQLVGVSYTDRKKGEIMVSQDEWVATGTPDNEPLAPYADGAAVTMLMEAQKAAALGLRPMAELLGFSVAGGDTVRRQDTGTAAVKKLLAQKGLTMRNISVLEVLENSAEDALAIVDGLGLDGGAAVNPLGGALGYGLNDGAEGIAMLQRVIACLDAGQLGLLCIYGAGGQGMAALVRKC